MSGGFTDEKIRQALFGGSVHADVPKQNVVGVVSQDNGQ